MGRWRGGGRDTTEGYRQLDVRRMQRGGFLRAGSWSSWRWSRNGEVFASIQVRRISTASCSCTVIVPVMATRKWTKEEYPVWLEWTRCYFGGERAWFLCPRPGCRRRVAILWGAMFYCRQCYNLAYESQNETVYDRALRKHQAIRMKLGGSGSLAEDFPTKPRGMHWRTYWRLVTQAEEAESRSWPPWVYRMMVNGSS